MKRRVMHPLPADAEKWEYAVDLGGEEEGYLRWNCLEGIVHADVSLRTELSLDEKLHVLQYLSEHLTRRYHPEKIVLDTHENMDWRLLESGGYYPKGKVFQKKTDPLRKRLEDRIFDQEGYIIDQGRMQSVPFGWFDTMQKGCGWIAAWNLLRLNGIEMPMQRVIDDLQKRSLLGEVFGVNLLVLMRYLQKNGLDVALSIPSDQMAVEAVKESSSGILIYDHSRGAHYAAFRHLQDESVHLYNAVYGKNDHEEDMSAFLKRNDLFPVSMVLIVRR